jgi:hypothetical protein
MLATSVDYLGTSDPIRDELRAQEDVRFVDRDEFCQLLVSRLTLSRCDVPNARVRGVFNASTGCRYLIEEELLFD